MTNATKKRVRNYTREPLPPNTKDVCVPLQCDNGHKVAFWVQNTEGTEEQPKGEYGEFANGDCVRRTSLDSYAHTHGGCCYRAANRTLHGLDVYTD